MNPIRLLILDDHVLFREGLSRLLDEEPDLHVVAQCSTSAEALALLASTPPTPAPNLAPDLILLDFDLGEENGFAFLDAARAVSFPGRILLVTAGMSSSDTARALQSGAAGLFLKHAPPPELVAAIRKVMSGEPLLSPAYLAQLRHAARAEQARRSPALALSNRERSVLRGVFAGLANKEIAAELDLSEGSVKAVLQQLFAKTGVRTRAQLVRIALEHHFDTDSIAGNETTPSS